MRRASLRRARRLGTLAVWIAIALAFGTRAHATPVWPAGFVDEPYVSPTFYYPTSMALLPDGRLLVTEKAGRLWVVHDDVRTLMWDHISEINSSGDRGLMTIAVDPDFAVNRYVYMTYVLSADSSGNQASGNSYGRLVRYQVSADDPDQLDESTRTVLIGATWSTGFPSASTAHQVDDLQWGSDGTLLISAGDGAHYDYTDTGGGDPNEFLTGRLDLEQDIGAFRALDLGSLGGKVLRVDPATGLGLPSNPYYDGNPASNQSRVWLYGLRNPYRICVRPGTGLANPALGSPGTLYVADVGWATFEEIDVARTSGLDYGWPCFEGFIGNNTYQLATPPAHGCDSFGTPSNPQWPKRPILEYHHTDGTLSSPKGVTGTTIVGGSFYTGTRYPQPYRGGYFFGDYSSDWIKVAVVDSSDALQSELDFGTLTDGPVFFMTDPATGDILYLAIFTGGVRRIRYAAALSVDPPTANAIRLSPPWPNPSAGAVAMSIELPRPAHIEWSITDATGRTVWNSPAREASAGSVPLVWSGVDRAGIRSHPGIYFASVRVDGHALSRRFALLR